MALRQVGLAPGRGRGRANPGRAQCKNRPRPYCDETCPPGAAASQTTSPRDNVNAGHAVTGSPS